MRVVRGFLVVATIALGGLACPGRPESPQPNVSGVEPGKGCPPTGETVQVEADGPSHWRVRIDACMGDASARGEARVRGGGMPKEGSSAFVLARARAWAALAREHQAAGRIDEALNALRRGLDALGDRYSSPQIIDDTPLKVAAAGDRIEAGAPSDAAAILLRVLETRLGMFAELHHPDGIDPL